MSLPGAAGAEHRHNQQGKKNPVNSDPVELIVNLPGAQQMLELLQSCVGPEIVYLARHVNPLKEFMQLPSSHCGVVSTFKAGQYRGDLVKPDPITTVIAVALSERQGAAPKGTGDDLSDFFNLVIFRI